MQGTGNQACRHPDGDLPPAASEQHLTQQLIDRVAALEEESRRRAAATEQLSERVVALEEQNQQLTSRAITLERQHEELVGQVAEIQRQLQERAEVQRHVWDMDAWWSNARWQWSR